MTIDLTARDHKTIQDALQLLAGYVSEAREAEIHDLSRRLNKARRADGDTHNSR